MFLPSRSAPLPNRRSGAAVILFGLAAPVVVVGGGAAIEYVSLTARRASMQKAADSAAIAAAQQLRLSNATDQVAINVARRMVRSTLERKGSLAFRTTAAVEDERTAINVKIVEPTEGIFGGCSAYRTCNSSYRRRHAFSVQKALPAHLGRRQGQGAEPRQVLVHDCDGLRHLFELDEQEGHQHRRGRPVTASQVCSAGGVEQKAGAIVSPSASTDCPQVRDPLGGIPRPSVGPCVATKLKVVSSVHLTPGRYCGGLEIKGSAQVTLASGTYVMDDGPLIVSDTASITGRNAGFFFTGSKGGMRLDPNTTISLSAPVDGEMAGILFFEDRTVTAPEAPPEGPKGGVPPPPYGSQPMRQYRITSNNAPMLLGTIYLPAGRLIIDASRPVADRSAYTVIVARQLELNSGPNLYLNSDYESTDVPVPQGVGSKSGAVALTH